MADPEKTPPYDFISTGAILTTVTENCLALLTFLPMEEVERLGSLKDEKLTKPKRYLHEVTKIVHGEEEARKAEAAALALFGRGQRRC